MAYLMNKKEIISMLMNKSMDIHGRINCAIDNLLRDKTTDDQAHKTAMDMAESLRYLADEIERIANR